MAPSPEECVGLKDQTEGSECYLEGGVGGGSQRMQTLKCVNVREFCKEGAYSACSEQKVWRVENIEGRYRKQR